MDERIKFFVGLDTHKQSTAVAACEAGRDPARFIGTISPDVPSLLRLLARAGDPALVNVVYEAGPTGYGLYRELSRRGYPCQIVAPSLIPRRAGDRVKTDRHDCARLAELSRAGELKPIWVPDDVHESMRNLWRAREDALSSRLRARQQLQAFLLRHGRRYPGKTTWIKAHEGWIAQQHFEHVGDRVALAEYQLAAHAAEQRVQRLTAALTEATNGWRFEPAVAALRALRGIDTVNAIGLVTEIGDIARFSSARQLMAYLGLVPSEYSSGNSIRRGSITKTGNAHARRLLTEAAWSYRFPARLSRQLRQRSAPLPETVCSHAWKAQQRLCARFARLSARGVQVNKVCVAVARELAGFVWAIVRQVSPA